MRLAGYEMGEVLGYGTVGVVRRGRDVSGREVALKLVPVGGEPEAGEPDPVLALEAMARAVAAVGHPGLLAPHHVLRVGGAVLLVADLMRGESLSCRLDRAARLDPHVVLTGAAEVAGALAALHGAGWSHGDLKPSNILLAGQGSPRLVDVGLASWLVAGTEWLGATFGTVEYLDPELPLGQPPGPAADLYALGVVCWEALAGRAPFTGPSPRLVLEAARRRRGRPRLSDAAPSLPVPAVKVVEAAMARRAADRPGSAGELAEALRSALDSLGRRGGPSLTPRPERRTVPARSPAGAPLAGAPLAGAPLAGAPLAGATAPLGAPGDGGEGCGDEPSCPSGPEAGPRPLRPRHGPLAVERGGPGTEDGQGEGRDGRDKGLWPSGRGWGPAGRRPWRRVPVRTMGAIAVVAVLAVVSGRWLTQQTASRGARPEDQCPVAAPAAGEVPVVAAGPVERLRVNVTGRGCSVVLWSQGQLIITAGHASRRFEVGRPGDELLLGAWNCTGRPRAALYRPSTGQVFYFSGWPGPRMALSAARAVLTGVVAGRAGVDAVGKRACPTVRVTPAFGVHKTS